MKNYSLIRLTLVLSLVFSLAILNGCGDDDDDTTNDDDASADDDDTSDDDDASADDDDASDDDDDSNTIPFCDADIELTENVLPCNCFGTEVTELSECNGEFKCSSPDLMTICEAEEIPACPEHTDLSTVELPCDCYGNVADEEKVAECGELEAHCCPGAKTVVCE